MTNTNDMKIFAFYQKSIFFIRITKVRESLAKK